MKQVYIILGNGFTIDLINFLNLKGQIDVSNLFKNGELVLWPGDDKPGFLSYKYCPNLWILGARPNIEYNSSINLIEDIITCANILYKNIIDNKILADRSNTQIYFKAYKELVTYLKALFIYYNQKVIFSQPEIYSWGWAEYFDILNLDSNISKVHIITFNYDIFLERVLKKLDINFTISGFEENDNKFKIYKPHGSISFSHKYKVAKEAFEIKYDQSINDANIDDFNIEYNNLSCLNMVNAMIPPAGDSTRLNFKWANDINDEIKKAANYLEVNDELIICGSSYWHVDRLEIDSILTAISPEIKDIKVINPNTPNVFNAVITTLFDNVTFYNNPEPITL
ncbi:MAG: hypothetical protein DWP97_04770 [Calditrichaeota bacterium]|nr:MAG: hypothetical protein DWP97_04770 [Calditrichota bacterium]